jgi:hypothetical protein
MTRRSSLIMALAALILLSAVVVAWVDPRPQPDTAAGPRMRLSVAGDCPASDAGMVGVQVTQTDLTYRMVPNEAPMAALICRYNWSVGQLTAIQRLDANRASALQSALRQTDISPPYGLYNCPTGTRDIVVMTLSYADFPDVDLWFDPNGCSFVANGLIVGRPIGLSAALAALG